MMAGNSCDTDVSRCVWAIGFVLGRVDVWRKMNKKKKGGRGRWC